MGGSVGRFFAVAGIRESGAWLACTAVLLWAVLAPNAQAQAQCAEVLAQVVSVQGKVEIRRGNAGWTAVERNAPLCRGDTIRVQQYGRAGVRLNNETLLRLDQGTILTLAPPDSRKATLIEQLSGGLHVITRTPRAFSVKTPIINANVSGTEFAVRTTDADASVVVFEGEVEASGASGTATLTRGEQVVASKEAQTLVKSIVVRPLDAVAWTLYFPAVFDARAARPQIEADPGARESAALYRAGRIDEALVALGTQAPETADTALLNYRAGLLLLVGRVDEAKRDLQAVLARAAANGEAQALLAVIAVVENDREGALALARRAIEVAPDSPAAFIALSYAQQASFDLEAAAASARQAIALNPASALARARGAELEMSLGRLDAALALAQEAVQLDPKLARTQTVLGFASLIRIDTAAASRSFERAIELDQSDPLPRLGLGLAMIRVGELAQGRGEIEIAAMLDPANSLVRSYLGKAYYEEGRDALAGGQYGLARQLDPRDPTPYLYDAVRKQVGNRPIEALEDLERSIELNDNRAVFRSRLMLDEDTATRRVSQARTYLDVGFDQLAINEAVKSMAADSGNSSAHRFLADYYVSAPLHDMARESELLQSQLLQPLNSRPAQPRLSAQSLAIVDQSLFMGLGASEYSQLMARQGLSLYADAGVGSWDSYAASMQVSGLAERAAFSAGYYAIGTDGYRENADRRYSTANAFVQIAADADTSLQAELRQIDKKTGDVNLTFFDAANFSPSSRETLSSTAGRLGLRHNFSPASVTLASYIYRRQTDTFVFPDADLTVAQVEKAQTLELRHIYQGSRYTLSPGIGVVDGTVSGSVSLSSFPTDKSVSKLRETNAYLYYTGNAARGLDITLGLSFDAYKDAAVDRQQWSPKFGVLWLPSDDTTLRFAAFRALKRMVVSDQTLEPTAIFGFNQFFSGINDINGTDSQFVGASVVHRFGNWISFGSELSARRVGIPATLVGAPKDFSVRETLWSSFLYWTPNKSTAVSVGLQYAKLDGPDWFPAPNQLSSSRTVSLPVQARHFDPSGFLASVRVTPWRQTGSFYTAASNSFVAGSDSATLLDVGVGYRFARNKGLVLLQISNLFDSTFNLQELDPQLATVSRRRTVFLKGNINL